MSVCSESSENFSTKKKYYSKNDDKGTEMLTPNETRSAVHIQQRIKNLKNLLPQFFCTMTLYKE